MSSSEDGTGIIMKDDNGISRTLLYASNDGSGLTLTVGSKHSMVTLNAVDNEPALTLNDENGAARVNMLITAKNEPLMYLTEALGKIAWRAP
jgi:hypothetical protein